MESLAPPIHYLVADRCAPTCRATGSHLRASLTQNPHRAHEVFELVAPSIPRIQHDCQETAVHAVMTLLRQLEELHALLSVMLPQLPKLVVVSEASFDEFLVIRTWR